MGRTQVGLRQLSGMLIMVFARNSLKEHIGEVRADGWGPRSAKWRLLTLS